MFVEDWLLPSGCLYPLVGSLSSLHVIVFRNLIISDLHLSVFIKPGLCDRVCFGDLGCFSDDLPCHKDFFPPMTPAEIGTRFTLYTRHPRNLSSPVNGSDFGGSWRVQFEGRRRSVFIIHGWGETDDKQWVMELKDALLDKVSCNFMNISM